MKSCMFISFRSFVIYFCKQIFLIYLSPIVKHSVAGRAENDYVRIAIKGVSEIRLLCQWNDMMSFEIWFVSCIRNKCFMVWIDFAAI